MKFYRIKISIRFPLLLNKKKMMRTTPILYVMCFLRNRTSFSYSKRQIILSGVNKNVLGIKQCTYSTIPPFKKNAQITPIGPVLKTRYVTFASA